MKIEYKFADGTVTEISTDETHGVVTIGGRRLEDGRAGGICMEEAQRLAEAAGNLCSLADRLQAAVDAAVAARASREGCRRWKKSALRWRRKQTPDMRRG